MNANALKILRFLSPFSTLLSPTQQSPFIPSNENAFHPSASSSNHLLEHLVSILSPASRLQSYTRYSTDIIGQHLFNILCDAIIYKWYLTMAKIWKIKKKISKEIDSIENSFGKKRKSKG